MMSNPNDSLVRGWGLWAMVFMVATGGCSKNHQAAPSPTLRIAADGRVPPAAGTIRAG